MRLRLTPLLAALAFALVPTAHAGITPRIVGGADATPGAHPFMAALVVPGLHERCRRHVLRGHVIAPYAFLTAAHCIIQDQPTPHTLGPDDLIVATGRTDLSVAGGQRLAVRKIVTHPGFDAPYALANDVAVVLTTAPTTSLPVFAPVAAGRGDTGTALGWGATVADPPSELSGEAPGGHAAGPHDRHVLEHGASSAPDRPARTSASAIRAARCS